MKLQVFSGLNLENDEFQPPETVADVVILAGDIAQGAQGMRWARRSFDKPIVYVLGNREFRDFDLGVIDLLKQEAAASGIYLLDRDSVEIGGVRFLGCTLWTDFDLFGSARRAEAMIWAEQWVEDFQFISDLGRPFTPQLARDRHLVDRAWLRQCLAESPRSKPAVVITHHAPHAGHLAQRRRADVVGAAFVSNLPDLLGNCAVWVHGSAHGYLDYTVGRTRVISNSRASTPERDLFIEQAPFVDDLTIEIAVGNATQLVDTTDRVRSTDGSGTVPMVNAGFQGVR